MPPVTRYCPKCAFSLAVPQPTPEKMACPQCKAVIRFGSSGSSGSRIAAPPAPAHAAAAVAAPPSKAIAGHTVQRELARGGLGVVYLAYHPHFAAFRAIKRPLALDGVDRGMLLARFRREVQAVGGLTSPHVVRAYDAGEDDEGPYLVTEYLDGESLSSLTARLCMLPVPEACEVVRQAALGLQAAHERGLVHRDVKPSNLMLTRAGGSAARVVVIDWGLVKMAGAADGSAHGLTRVRTELGTLDYMSPEQVRDASQVDIRADIYSLGVTLYTLLAGQPPFAGRTDEEKRLAHETEKLPRLDQVRPNIPRPLLDVVEWMVKKNLAERYATPAAVAQALQPFCCREPHLLLALLAPRPVEPAAPTFHMKDVLTAGTVLAPAPTTQAAQDGSMYPAPLPTTPAPHYAAPAPPAPSRSRWGLWLGGLLVLGLCLLLCTGTVGFVLYQEVWKDKDANASGKDKDKDSGKPAGPRILIDENFSKAYENRAISTLPEKWRGEGYRVGKESDEHYLELDKPVGVQWVTVPAGNLNGDFQIEGVVHLTGNHNHLTIRLESTKITSPLVVIFDHSGKIAIGDDARAAPKDFKPNVPFRFAIKREGKKLRVFLNEDVSDKDLGMVVEYDTFKLSLSAEGNTGRGSGGGPGGGPAGRQARLYQLKVVAGDVSGPPEASKPPPAPAPAPAGRGARGKGN